MARDNARGALPTGGALAGAWSPELLPGLQHAVMLVSHAADPRLEAEANKSRVTPRPALGHTDLLPGPSVRSK